MKYQYTRSPAFPHLRGGLPLIEIALYHEGHEITVPALVDSGAAMSVLPYDAGLELGLAWEEQTQSAGTRFSGFPGFLVPALRAEPDIRRSARSVATRRKSHGLRPNPLPASFPRTKRATFFRYTARGHNLYLTPPQTELFQHVEEEITPLARRAAKATIVQRGVISKSAVCRS